MEILSKNLPLRSGHHSLHRWTGPTMGTWKLASHIPTWPVFLLTGTGKPWDGCSPISSPTPHQLLMGGHSLVPLPAAVPLLLSTASYPSLPYAGLMHIKRNNIWMSPWSCQGAKASLTMVPSKHTKGQLGQATAPLQALLEPGGSRRWTMRLRGTDHPLWLALSACNMSQAAKR
jgi:hypothetical protein